MTKYEIIDWFEKTILDIEKKLNIDLRVDNNYSSTTNSVYPVINMLDNDGELIDTISVRISDHSRSRFELSKDLMFYFDDFKNKKREIKKEIINEILKRI